MRKLALALAAALLLLLTACGEKQTSEITLHYTLSISCETLAQNPKQCREEKRAYLPQSGMLLAETELEVPRGTSVYDALQSACREAGIPLDAAWTALYKSAYVKGIGNLYEFDGGKDSGWMYSVNGEFPNYGCSQYILEEGDAVRWVYTCDLGKDVNAGDTVGG